MKTLLALLLLMGTMQGQTDKPCLIVQSVAGMRLGTAVAMAGVFGFGLAHGDRFPYLESRNLKVKDIKDQYKKKDLEKLEAAGVKVIITNGAERRGRSEASISVHEQKEIDANLEAARQSCEAQ